MASEQGLAPAGIATYQKAYLIFFLPHSIVTVSLVTALLPGLSRLAHSGALGEVSHTLTDTIRTVIALVVPITAILMPLAPLLASLLFGYGAATAQQAKRDANESGTSTRRADTVFAGIAKGAGIALKNVDRFSFLMR